MSYSPASKRTVTMKFRCTHGSIRVDLSLVVEEAVEGCWIGSRARLSAVGQSEIGSVYAPPPQSSALAFPGIPVETIIDIQYRAAVGDVSRVALVEGLTYSSIGLEPYL